jgi:hypothetical protein
LVTNASVTPARVARSGADDTGKFDEIVLPVTYALPSLSIAMPKPWSLEEAFWPLRGTDRQNECHDGAKMDRASSLESGRGTRLP